MYHTCVFAGLAIYGHYNHEMDKQTLPIENSFRMHITEIDDILHKTHWSNILKPYGLVVMVAVAYISIQCKRLCLQSLADAFCGTFPESL
jgi:hypothetical protein